MPSSAKVCETYTPSWRTTAINNDGMVYCTRRGLLKYCLLLLSWKYTEASSEDADDLLEELPERCEVKMEEGGLLDAYRRISMFRVPWSVGPDTSNVTSAAVPSYRVGVKVEEWIQTESQTPNQMFEQTVYKGSGWS